MNLRELLPYLEETTAFQELITRIDEPRAEDVPAMGLQPAARAYAAAALYHSLGRPVLLLAGRSDRVRTLADELRAWLGEASPVYVFAEPDSLPYERVPWSERTIRDRLASLAALTPRRGAAAPGGADAPAPIVLASVRALLSKTLPPREFHASDRLLYRGQRILVSSLAQALVAAGYEPDAVVDRPGTFSMRGGIIDIFSPHTADPVRVELWGEEVDSLRLFDPSTQRSQRQVESYRVAPASEALPGPGQMAAERLADWDFSNCHAAATVEIKNEILQLQEARRFRGVEFYIPYIYSAPASLLSYLPDDAIVLAEDWQQVRALAYELQDTAEALKRELEAGGDLPGGVGQPSFRWEEIEEASRRFRRFQLGWATEDEQAGAFEGVIVAAPHFGGQLRLALDEMAEFASRGRPTVVVSRQARRLSSLLADQQVNAVVADSVPVPLPQSSVVLVEGYIEGGWELRRGSNGAKPVVLLTDSELFGWVKPEPRRARQQRTLTPETFFADVKPGDYVVHVEQGIGVFRGLVKLDVDGEQREYLQIDYQGSDRLYVPIDQADRLSRYVGPSDKPPTLSRLGTADWGLVKARARRAVKSIAKELLELYSVREVITGHAFQPDTEWQADLESAFPYVETEDQAEAIAAVKADMERAIPTDRLICGDVGYGKTEVALRAAFKAVMDSKQVAVLVPTTVLAQQHYETFRERMKSFPVNVEMLSRFKSKREQKQVLEGLASGRVDIVIGTHRLLQSDVQFKDLGLLIIDEEQRFGVAHKEWLKQKRREIDVLTLTATPIPRTLYMALAGARDMSTIDTPPEDRLPVKTYVGEYDEHLIRRAILREMDRGGQVYFVHNRVQGIRQIAQRVAKIVPEAHIGIAHGQMPEAELEKAMLDFANGQLDVLVCTSIIESGLDIPNANTIIINRADQFGLAQLYQLRGRVGRSAQRAYAYLLYPRHQPLSAIARKRLDTIMQASELGAGFRIAMRDLEIRGAGELLGARQHGHIAAVGFDLYCRLLAQSVSELKGESQPAVLDEATLYLRPLQSGAQLNLPIHALLPEAYVKEGEVRLHLYRRMASAADLEELDDLAQELVDRFGPLPDEAENLLFLMRVKALATQCDVRVIGQEADQIVVRAPWLYQPEAADLRQRLPSGARLGRGQIWMPLDSNWKGRLERTLLAMNEYYSLMELQSQAGS